MAAMRPNRSLSVNLRRLESGPRPANTSASSNFIGLTAAMLSEQVHLKLCWQSDDSVSLALGTG